MDVVAIHTSIEDRSAVVSVFKYQSTVPRRGGCQVSLILAWHFGLSAPDEVSLTPWTQRGRPRHLRHPRGPGTIRGAWRRRKHISSTANARPKHRAVRPVIVCPGPHSFTAGTTIWSSRALSRLTRRDWHARLSLQQNTREEQKSPCLAARNITGTDTTCGNAWSLARVEPHPPKGTRKTGADYDGPVVLATKRETPRRKAESTSEQEFASSSQARRKTRRRWEGLRMETRGCGTKAVEWLLALLRCMCLCVYRACDRSFAARSVIRLRALT